MSLRHAQIVLASTAIVLAAILSQVMVPKRLMARTAASPSLEEIIPRQFGTWRFVPEISPIKPIDTDAYFQPDERAAKVYSQEAARGYSDGQGNIVMLLVAYGPVQNYRLKAHRPEICYTANGFRVSGKTATTLQIGPGESPINVARLIAERESRLEPITYWMRVGNDISNGVIDNQLSRLKYGLNGIIPDGALIRISTIGLSEDAAFRLQDQFIRDLLRAIPAQELKFFVGAS
ncbi:exosortase-associated protein EpsI, V-type [Bradyrhizobium sp. SZCCHNS2096]|uniref:exosortase-associated protein EpsI, V-type n=1 Tax=Bradyrhizobium sp. SZCCHNS2096 TaxID=3057309 RepID=UPI00291645B8|nr:exosortase-associated protein EpsI, V-type [Bradyrhizobium sp. SZCCHNS2096]